MKTASLHSENGWSWNMLEFTLVLNIFFGGLGKQPIFQVRVHC